MLLMLALAIGDSTLAHTTIKQKAMGEEDTYSHQQLIKKLIWNVLASRRMDVGMGLQTLMLGVWESI